MRRCEIVVPIYKPLDEIEKYSLQVLLAAETNIPVCLVKPDSLQFEQTNRYNIISVDDKHFASVEAYSEMCKSHWFYSLFKENEYICIYQLDCLLVNSNILSWCDRGYDYVGAPIISNNANWDRVPAIGNGGFSLRKVSKFLELTDPSGKFMQTYANEYASHTKKYLYDKYEDLYFCEFVSNRWRLTTPSYKEAIKFSIDMNPDCIDISQLPVGIHAFDKNIPFWKDKLKIPENIVKACINKNKQFICQYYTLIKTIR